MKAYVLDAKRTPIGRSHPEKGMYRGVRADELLAVLIRRLASDWRLLEATPTGGTPADDVVIGCVGQHLEQGKNIARLASLLAGLPPEVPGVTVNRLCGSSLQAFHYAAATVERGDGDLLLAGGVEHMQHVPMTAALDYSKELLGRYEFPFTQMGLTAERVAERHRVRRDDQDAFALGSHRKAVEATEKGWFAGEIVPVPTPEGEASRDQCPRGDSSIEALAALKPAFRDGGTVTAGNSSPISDGASLALVASEEGCRRLGARPRAEVLGSAVVGLDPLMMGLGPIPAIRKLLARTGLSLPDIDLFEINEAFASQAIACTRELRLPPEKVNPAGGAIALGHPLGCTGTRLVATLLSNLERTGGEFGIVSMCIGHGQGIATALRRIHD